MVNPLCPLANPFCGCCLFGPCPVFCLVCCFLLTKRKSGWGICGSSWLLALCCLLVDFDLHAFMDQLCPCTNVFLTAYSHVRTEPLSDIGQTRGKKNLIQKTSKMNPNTVPSSGERTKEKHFSRSPFWGLFGGTQNDRKIAKSRPTGETNKKLQLCLFKHQASTQIWK